MGATGAGAFFGGPRFFIGAGTGTGTGTGIGAAKGAKGAKTGGVIEADATVFFARNFFTGASASATAAGTGTGTGGAKGAKAAKGATTATAAFFPRGFFSIEVGGSMSLYIDSHISSNVSLSRTDNSAPAAISESYQLLL